MENLEQILDAPPSEKLRLNYAGFWIRTGAYFIDFVILAFVNYIIESAFEGSEPWALAVNSVVGILYFAVLESSDHQGTAGKMVVGIKVGDRDGNPISFLNAIGRYFAKIISALLLGIGFMMVGWDEKCQGIHDKLADTYVFYSR